MSDRYAPLGATGDQAGLYVHFESGFGLNVVIGFRWKNSQGVMEDFPEHQFRMSIDGFEKLGELVDEWRERTADDAHLSASRSEADRSSIGPDRTQP